MQIGSVITALAVQAAVAAAAAAPPPPPPAQPGSAPYQVVRPGDGAMSCEALIAEINGLTAEMHGQETVIGQRVMATENASSSASAATGLAASFLPFGGGMISAAASGARESALNASMQTAYAQRMAIQGKYDRVQHLEALTVQKSC